MPQFNTIPEAIDEMKAGRMIIVTDDEDRENEGDLVMAADAITADAINFMSIHGRGLICMPMTGGRLDALNIPMMVQNNTEHFGTAFCAAVDARLGVSTGISAKDRALTIRTLADPRSLPDNLVMPGHIFPLRAKEGGVLERVGHTEASVDLARIAGRTPAGVICEVLTPDGSMARVPYLLEFAREHGLKIVTIADLIKHRMKQEKLILRAAEAKLPTQFGKFTAITYTSAVDGNEHIALVKGDIRGDHPTLVRVHSECLTGDVFGSLRCDCGEQLHRAMAMVSARGAGVILYMRQEGRGIGLHNKMKAYQLQDEGKDTVEANEALGFQADLRDYGIGAQILVDLGVRKMELMTNNPRKVAGLEGYGLELVARVPIQVVPNEANVRYLKTKRDKLGHHLTLGEGGGL